jgi:preprotein translocase subunit Sec61beta
MANNKIQMPTSTAGLTRYFDDFKSKIELKPGHVIILGIVILVITVALHIFAGGFLGL